MRKHNICSRFKKEEKSMKTTIGILFTASQLAAIDELVVAGNYGNTRAAVVRAGFMIFIRGEKNV